MSRDNYLLNFITRRKVQRRVGGKRMLRLRDLARKRGCVKDVDGQWHFSPGRVEDPRDDFTTVM